MDPALVRLFRSVPLAFALSLLPALLPIPAAGADGPSPPDLVRAIRVLPDRAPDCTSLAAIAASVTRGSATNDEKAVALYNFLDLALYHQQYPNESGGISALKLVNSYGWSLCGGEHTVEAALWKAAGWKWRYVGWSNPGHTTVEAFYDGSWHYLDVFLRFYAWRSDPAAPGGRTIASQADLGASPSLLGDGFVFDPARKVHYAAANRCELIGDAANWTAPAFLVCGDDIPGIVSGIASSRPAGSPEGWNAIVFDDPSYSADVDLAPGWSLTLLWDPIPGAHWFSGRSAVPAHGCGDKDFRNSPAIGPILEPYRGDGPFRRSFGSGRLTFAPDLSTETALGGFAAVENVRVEAGALVPADPARPASVSVLLRSPYVLTRARAAAEGIEKAEISMDGGKTFGPADPGNLDDAVGGRYAAILRLTFRGPLRGLRIEAVVQCNPPVLPFLSPGRNEVSVSVAEPARLGPNRLAVTYAYRTGERSKPYAGLIEEDKEIARGHDARWSKDVTVVRKIFAASDLPARFEIAVPTPRGAQPVYPRMLFLRREVLAPGARPADLPEGAREPAAVTAVEDLPTLPLPFLIGTAQPPARVVRPTEKRAVGLRRIGFVDATGAVTETGTLRWPKVPGENVVPGALLLAGDLGDLPPPREIHAARLVVPIAKGHDRAPGQLGAVLLAAPFEPGKPFEFGKLGEPAGAVVIPLQPADRPEYRPPVRFPIDVTRAVKAVAAGSAFHGFALRMVPSRPVDDGWTVRADIPPGEGIALEIETYIR